MGSEKGYGSEETRSRSRNEGETQTCIFWEALGGHLGTTRNFRDAAGIFAM